MAGANPTLLEGLRGELRREGVKLWLPPYTRGAGEEPPAGSPLEALAAAYAPRVGAAAAAVAAALEELRLHAVEKLRAKSRVTLLARAAGGQGRGEPLCVEFDAASRGEQVRAELCRRLRARQLKAIAGGRCLQDGQSLAEQGWTCDGERQGQPLKVLLFPSGEAPAAEAGGAGGQDAGPDEAMRAEASAASEDPAARAPEPEARCTVAQIREAAEQLTAEGFGDFELSDAVTGRLVPVPPAARQALIAAIALHALGREALYEHGEGGEGAAAGSLEFLAEADRCFERCREAGAGQLLEQIDNFGQLQLDICWAYALLGDADHLPDAEKRLEAADRMFRRKVDRNFLTLAEVKAEQGHVLPPEVLPSVRVWLLRGVARRCRGDVTGAREDLARAATFMRALRVDETAVEVLLSLGATRAQAVAALRRCAGSRERAAEELVAAEAQRRAAGRERERQRELGQTADGSFVDAECLAQLESMGIARKAAIEALKKTNNDVEAALEAAACGQRRGAAEESPKEVDELALASLLSLGFERGPAEAALRATSGGSDAEEALLALTAAAAAAPGAGTSGSSGSCSEPPAPVGSTDEAAAAAAAAQAAAASQAAEAEAAAKAEAERAAKRAKKEALDAARELVERELGNCLRRAGVEDDLAGASLLEEEALLQQHLSGLEG